MRATTVIFEEDGSLEEATTVNIVLPNRPHATALQVEELGSYKLEQHEQSVSYHILDNDGEGKSSVYTQGIIDEVDSDNDHMRTHASVTTSRNISINSVSEDEATPTGSQITRELYVNEETKNIELDDGFAEVKVKRIVLHEEEVITAEIHEADEVNAFTAGDARKGVATDLQSEVDGKRSRAKIASVEAAVDGETDDAAQKPQINRQSSLSNDTSRKGSLYDIEEKNENADLTPEEAKQLRIKEIRAKARRASLMNKEQKTEGNALDDDGRPPSKPVVSDVGIDGQDAQRGKLLDQGTKDEVDAEIKPSQRVKEEPIDTSKPLQNGAKAELEEAEEDRDEYLENLLKRAQRQRSAFEEIIEHKEAEIEEEPVKRKTVIDVEEAVPTEIEGAKQPLDTKVGLEKSDSTSGI